jgi:hypothetical protein
VQRSSTINDVLKLLLEPLSKFDPRVGVVILDPSNGRAIVSEQHGLAGTPVAVESCNITTYLPDYVSIEADCPTDGVVVLTDRFYPGWQCSIDGRPIEIYQANAMARGVFVAKGRHKIEFNYEPDSFNIGLKLWSAGAVLLLACLLIAMRLRRRADPPTPS